MEGDDGACEVPASACWCAGQWRVEEAKKGEEEEGGKEVVAEEGSTEDDPRELGVRSGREE
jgi:hypothetical protein